MSVQSIGSSVAAPLQNSSSNVSQLTNYTDFTSPTSSQLQRPFDKPLQPTRTHARREITPENRVVGIQTNGDYTLASPVSVTSPVSTNGAKRTASGHVKNAPSLPSTPLTGTFAGRSRGDSISSTTSRAGEMAASLKTRLEYAMAKVQNGWEHKNIAEVEQLAAHKVYSNRHSMSHVDYGNRPTSSGINSGTAQLSMYDAYAQNGTTSPPSKRRSGTFNAMISSSQPRTALGPAPRLQPAFDHSSTANSRAYHTAPSSQTTNYTNAMSPPRTPVNGQTRRPPMLRTDTQTAEAERDALQALFQLGSPHASQVPRHPNASQASSSQASPLRTEFPTPRRVTFARSESESSTRSSDAAG